MIVGLGIDAIDIDRIKRMYDDKGQRMLDRLFRAEELAYLATKLDGMPEGDGTVLDHSCLMFLSNMWIGRTHNNTRLPIVLAGGLSGTLRTGRTLNYVDAGDDNRKVCSLYLSIMDRMGVKLERFGDAETRLDI